MPTRLKILIVDDDRGAGVTLSDILVEKGYEVVVVKSGAEALKEMKSSSFDIALIDIMMPVLNGVETFREAKKRNSVTSFIMMTGDAAEEMIEEALLEGAYDVVYKPLKIEWLVSLIERCSVDKVEWTSR